MILMGFEIVNEQQRSTCFLSRPTNVVMIETSLHYYLSRPDNYQVIQWTLLGVIFNI